MNFTCKDCGKTFSVDFSSLDWKPVGSSDSSLFEAEYEERCTSCIITHRITIQEKRAPGGVTRSSIETVGVVLHYSNQSL